MYETKLEVDRCNILLFGVWAMMDPILYCEFLPKTAFRHCERSTPWALSPLLPSSGFSPCRIRYKVGEALAAAAIAAVVRMAEQVKSMTIVAEGGFKSRQLKNS